MRSPSRLYLRVATCSTSALSPSVSSSPDSYARRIFHHASAPQIGELRRVRRPAPSHERHQPRSTEPSTDAADLSLHRQHPSRLSPGNPPTHARSTPPATPLSASYPDPASCSLSAQQPPAGAPPPSCHDQTAPRRTPPPQPQTHPASAPPQPAPTKPAPRTPHAPPETPPAPCSYTPRSPHPNPPSGPPRPEPWTIPGAHSQPRLTFGVSNALILIVR